VVEYPIMCADSPSHDAYALPSYIFNQFGNAEKRTERLWFLYHLGPLQSILRFVRVTVVRLAMVHDQIRIGTGQRHDCHLDILVNARYTIQFKVTDLFRCGILQISDGFNS